jgi:shikimate kinase/3-dehydroquinate synthase
MTDRVFISGPMGSGKSAVAASLASLWGTSAVDLDALIEQRSGQTVSALFAARGEAAFRALERELLELLLGDAAVRIVALGGGTVTDKALRHRLLAAGTLVTLRAPLATLVARVGQGEGRPLLSDPSTWGPQALQAHPSASDVATRLSRILEERAAAYAECHAEIDADRPLQSVATAIDQVVSAAPIVVPLGERTYRVEVGAGVRHGLAERVERAISSRKVVLVTDTGVHEPWARSSAEALEQAGFSVSMALLNAGEEHKNIGSIERIWDVALEASVDRDALVLGVGGGVVGDMAGFAASTILRGIALGQLPTTLLAMVDSAVGGKTGIDRAQGKNLIGSFHQPRFVLCDVETLATLPLAERRAGLAEVVKSAWLDGEASVSALEQRASELLAGDLLATSEAVRMAVQLKARIVTADEKETGVRALLNLGHTLGHAIEAAGGYTALRHGEAVALGMVAAYRVAVGLGRATRSQADRMQALLARLGLPTDLDRHLDARAMTFLGSDKKRKGGRVRFIVPSEPGQTEIVPLSADEIARLALGTSP